jgi:hypothetical protein
MGEQPTLAELNKVNWERAKVDRQLTFSTYPELLYPIWLRPCTVRILMVTDGGGSFTNADFGLTELINVLSVSPGPYVRFAVTKAHRSSTATNADLTSFQFDTHDLSQYDEIWMFAVARGSGSISDSELKAIATFMDGGGGVFATGDHEDLGVVMCGKIPRVRSMRRWWWPDVGPNGEPVAPNVGGPDRHDTNMQGAFAPTEFQDQSDDVPQVISPKLYHSPTPFIFREHVYPHPLLCGPKGVLRYLPDHPHEGQCEVPSDLTMSFNFDGSTFVEYPALPSGSRLAPEVIAFGHNGPGIVDFGKGSVQPHTIGSIGAYDGHRTSVGRVVVDSTWHHFFNINLIGDPSAGEAAQRAGFGASPAGLAKYEDIKAYYRNIAVWLARPQRHVCMRWRILWDARWYSRLLMDFRPYKDLRLVPLAEFIRLGTVARDVLGRLASQCQSTDWLFDIFAEFLPELIIPIRPWPPLPDPLPDFDPTTVYYAHVALNASLGAVLYAIADRYPDAGDEVRDKLEDEDRDLIAQGVALAVERIREAMSASADSLREHVDRGRQAAGA